MKKLVLICALGCVATLVQAQKAPSENFDKRYRFGLRITPQPVWLSTNDKNIDPKGLKFGFGFGLNMEYKLSEVACILTGIGGDLESGRYTYRREPGVYSVYYELTETGEFTKPVNGQEIPKAMVKKTSNKGYLVKQRTLNTTYITIPAILKLSTSEYNGFKYFGAFGVEIGFRARAEATDEYHETYSYSATQDTILPKVEAGGQQTKLDLGGFKGDALGGIVRAGLNVGGGMEWRIGGSTSFFASINYFRSFTNSLKSKSDYLVYKTDYSSGKAAYKFIDQNLIFNAIRINIGFMF